MLRLNVLKWSCIWKIWNIFRRKRDTRSGY